MASDSDEAEIEEEAYLSTDQADEEMNRLFEVILKEDTSIKPLLSEFQSLTKIQKRDANLLDFAQTDSSQSSRDATAFASTAVTTPMGVGTVLRRADYRSDGIVVVYLGWGKGYFPANVVHTLATDRPAHYPSANPSSVIGALGIAPSALQSRFGRQFPPVVPGTRAPGLGRGRPPLSPSRRVAPKPASFDGKLLAQVKALVLKYGSQVFPPSQTSASSS